MPIALNELLARVKHHRTDLHGGEHLYALQVAANFIGSECLLKSVPVSVPTVIGQNVYDVAIPSSPIEGMDEEIKRIASVQLADGSFLREANSQEVFSYMRSGVNAEVGQPAAWMDRFGTLVLYPTPDSVITITVNAYVAPATTAEVVDMPTHAINAIVTRAIYELMLIPGEGMNPSLVNLWAHRALKEFGNYKGSVDLGTSGIARVHISSPYGARVRNGYGAWMRG